MIWHGIVRPTATTEINHLTTIKTPRKSPVNRLNGYLFLTALAFASGVIGYKQVKPLKNEVTKQDPMYPLLQPV